MPDQYDPKQTPRSASDRRQADPRTPSAKPDDPLAELARIVQGRPSPVAAQAAKAAPRSANSANQGGEGSGTADLEAELLNDLQASFAAVREAAAALTPVTRTQAQPPAPPPQPPRSRSVESEPVFAPQPPALRPTSQPAPPARAESRPESRTELRAEFRPEPFDESRLIPIPTAPVIQPSVPPAIAERQADRRSAPDYAAEPPAERRVDRQARTVPPPVAESTSDLGGFQLRPTTTAGAAMSPPARQPHSRWEKPEPPKPQSAAPSRFAPPQTAAPAEPQAFDDADLDPFAEGGLFSEPAEAAEGEDAFPLDGFGMVPGYGDDEGLPPYDDEDVAARGRSRQPSRNLIIVGAVVAIAIVGGVAVAMFRSGGASSGPPPTILADGGPTKITPADSGSPATADADAQNKLIYDRVNSAEANTDTTLLTPDSGPIQNAGSTDANNAISRVILPGGPGFDAPAAGNATPAGQQPDAATPPATAPTAGVDVASNEAANTDAIEPIGPRKVRTVVVRPDGTILSSDATDATPPAAAAPAAAAPVTPQATPAPAAPITDDTAAIAGNGGNALAITTTPDVTSSGVTTNANTTVDAQATPATPPAAAVPAPAAVAVTVPATPKPAKAKPAPTVVAQADLNAPIDLTPGVPAGQAATAAADGVLVQISSQRSEDAARATYKDLQARYPNILGKYDVNLQRADVPDRGTFYRVRVGPFSASDAQRLCDDLKSAGGDCVLAKR